MSDHSHLPPQGGNTSRNEGAGQEKVKKALLGLVGAVVLVGGFFFMRNLGYHQGYAPAQPVPFSHKLHAGMYRIPCMYCHTGAEKSKHATVPAANVCMNCHVVVKTDSPYIKKVKEHFEAGKPMPWIKVHDLPDHTYFPHNRHIARGLQCETCHGQVAEMDRVTQQQTLSMGWCLDCHRGVTTPDYLFSKGEKRGPVAPQNCNTCHH